MSTLIWIHIILGNKAVNLTEPKHLLLFCCFFLGKSPVSRFSGKFPGKFDWLYVAGTSPKEQYIDMSELFHHQTQVLITIQWKITLILKNAQELRAWTLTPMWTPKMMTENSEKKMRNVFSCIRTHLSYRSYVFQTFAKKGAFDAPKYIHKPVGDMGGRYIIAY